MNKLITIICILICFSLINSCSSKDLMEKFVPKKEAKLAEDYLTKLREKDYDLIKSNLSPELKPQLTDELLVKMSEYFRSGDLLSTEIIGSQVNVFNGVWHGNFTFEYHFTTGWNIANAAFRKIGDKYEVIGLNVYQTEMPQEEFHGFRLSNKTILHYLILTIAIIVPIFILVSTYFCIRTPIPKRKWLWVIFVLIGVSTIKINWTTGQYAIQLESVNLLGAAVHANGPYAPWVISASFPLGAIMFWIKRKRFIVLNREVNKAILADVKRSPAE